MVTKENKAHIKILELKAAKLTIKKNVVLVHIRMDMTALAYLMKMEGSKKQELVSLTKDT